MRAATIAKPPSRRFDSLDGLRGCAALGIVLYHLGLRDPAAMWVPHGYLAVDLFFGLSGVVIAHAYEQKLLTGLGLPEFLRARLARLYPLYALGLGLGALAFSLAVPTSVEAATALAAALSTGALVIPMVTSEATFPLNAPLWSLFCELVINLAYGACVRFLTTTRLLVVIALSAVGLAICSWRGDGLEGGDDPVTFLTGLVRVGFSFPVGILIYRLHVAGILPRGRLFLPLAVCGLSALMTIPLTGASNYILDFVLVGLACPLILVFGLQADAGLLGRACAAIGALSYPIYVVHQPMFVITHLWLAEHAVGWSLAIGVPASCLAAWLALRFESNLRRLFGTSRAKAYIAAEAPTREM
jgi:peptidoglycan/LPS O-acetylase OafA/YrhL